MVNVHDERSLVYWIWLSKFSKITLREKRLLLKKFQRPEDIFLAGSGVIKSILGCEKITPSDFDLEICNVDLEWIDQSDQHVIVGLYDDLYPPRLREINDPPLLLYVKGDVSCLANIQVSVVGSRKQTPLGRKMTEILSGGLARSGVTITSGLALGVDATAHEASINRGGDTIAVLGCGVDKIYPLANKPLFTQIVENGCLVSEFPLETPPRSQNFPIRNRVISGLSSGLVVVEAALRSGSLITARLASEQGREVFAVPGSPLSPQSRGCHYLIQQGAKLVECVDDILEELVLDFRNSLQTKSKIMGDPAPMEQEGDGELLKWIGFDPTSLNDIIQLSGLTSAEVSSMLLDMELMGRIYRDDNGFYSRL